METEKARGLIKGTIETLNRIEQNLDKFEEAEIARMCDPDDDISLVAILCEAEAWDRFE